MRKLLEFSTAFGIEERYNGLVVVVTSYHV